MKSASMVHFTMATFHCECLFHVIGVSVARASQNISDYAFHLVIMRQLIAVRGTNAAPVMQYTGLIKGSIQP